MVSTSLTCHERCKNRSVQFKHANRFKKPLPLPKRRFSDIGAQNISPSWIHQSVSDVKPSESHGSTMWNYLKKLKNLFSNPFPQTAVRENSASKIDKAYRKHSLRSSLQRASSLISPSRYTVNNLPRPRKAELQTKVYSVICTAIEDGFANKALKRKRNYFILKTVRSSGFHRAATDDPSRYCRGCYMTGASRTGAGSFLKGKSKKVPKQGRKRRPARLENPVT